MSPRIPIDVNEVIKMVEMKYNSLQIAYHMKTTTMTIYSRLDEYPEVRKKLIYYSRSSRYSEEVVTEEALLKCIKRDLSIPEIGKELNTSYATVRKYALKFNMYYGDGGLYEIGKRKQKRQKVGE